MSEREVFYGVVVWFNSKTGYGFIAPDNGGIDIFAHYSDVVFDGFKTLQKGQKVSYEIGLNNRGQNKAVLVSVIK